MIGYSRTYVFARERTEHGVLDALREGRTVVYDRWRAFGDPAMIQMASENGGLPRAVPELPAPGAARLISLSTETSTVNWFSRLPVALQRRAYTHRDEAAWPREDAVEVIEALSTFGETVLGVDVWLRTDGAPRIPSEYLYQWDSAEMNASTPKRSARDINAAAVDYVKMFQWDPRDVRLRSELPYFNLTV